ncbi:hypothetical protein RTP6_002098 [Batrachochytrium dendrobatidis]
MIVIYLIFTLFEYIDAVRSPLVHPFDHTPLNQLSKRSRVELTGNFKQCFAIQMTVEGVDMKLMVDSGTTDTGVATTRLSHYDGPAIKLDHVFGLRLNWMSYVDRSYWFGYAFNGRISIPGTTIWASQAPITGITIQSTRPLFMSPNINGILGISYPENARYHGIHGSVIDAFFNENTIDKNEVAIQMCSYSLTHDSYIDIGNKDIEPKCGTDGTPLIWIKSPSRKFITVTVLRITVDNQLVKLPKGFQRAKLFTLNQWSLFDVCSTHTQVPDTVFEALKKAIKTSKAILSHISDLGWEGFFCGKLNMPNTIKFDWKKFPTISFTMESASSLDSATDTLPVVVTLSGMDYIQQNERGEYQFLIRGGYNRYVSFGISSFLRLKITIDRTNGNVGLGPGCNCEHSIDGYPALQDPYGKIWRSPM